MAIQEETKLASIIDLQKHPIDENHYREKCKTKLDKSGVLVLDNFLFESSVKSILAEAKAQENLAYYCVNEHNVYLDPFDKELSKSHPRNKTVSSSKGCITDDQVPEKSSLRALYNSPTFKDFLCVVLGETVLYKYDDNLSSINIHYAKEGQELGWHFDNSSFAITLLIQKPEAGGQFEYIRQFRNSDNNDNNYDGVLDLLNGSCNPEKLLMENGTLVLFRGKDAIHRVTPTIGNRTRILSVLAYNSKPDVSLSESARMTFFGKLY
ncbi:2OG-Fe(II) oxygenase [Candidatus Thioglobus sp.]|nr:2OG-Fe(II) oxygenase [Candidatus Thioglobus sp.]|tara:strand:- start:11693 stop:12490 length:798 start_codon:yes stop_codon:yes gene_type:complete